jgi:conjugal transfer pilin signal peptidase TrbI
MSKKTNFVLKILALLSLYVGLLFFGETNRFGFRINRSNSLPFTLFYSSKFSDIKRNQFVSFQHLGYSKQIAKQILGLPGDAIEVRDHNIMINDEIISIWKDRSTSGKPYHPIEPQEIPEGYVYVHATHPDSFDSRYAEFGLIKVTDLEEELWPIF